MTSTSENVFTGEPSLKRKIFTRLSLRRSKRKSCLRSLNNQSIELTGLVTPAKRSRGTGSVDNVDKLHCNFTAKDLEERNGDDEQPSEKSKESKRRSLFRSKASSSSLQAAIVDVKEQALEHVEGGISRLQGERYEKLTSTPVNSKSKRKTSRSSLSKSNRQRPFQSMWNAVRRRVHLLRNSHQTLDETASPCRRYLDGSIVSHTGLDGELPAYRIETPYKLRSSKINEENGTAISP